MQLSAQNDKVIAMPKQDTYHHFTARLDRKVAARIRALIDRVRQPRHQVLLTLLNGWDMLTPEQQFAAIRGEVIRDAAESAEPQPYRHPNASQAQPSEFGDDRVSPEPVCGRAAAGG